MSSRLSPAVAATRNALRSLDLTGLVLVACSGGADSLALAAAARFVSSRDGWQAGLVTVDHQLQEGSALRASSIAALPGFSPSVVVPVEVGFSGGPEAAARDARYQALAATALSHGASCVLLGHSQDDQAETVLLALTRGAGPQGLSGMPVSRLIHDVLFIRPFLGLSRAALRQACVDQELSIWDDPHNADPSYTRSRLRLTGLAETLGADVVPNLARSAALIAADAAYLDALAASEFAALPSDSIEVSSLEKMPGPIRTRVLRLWAVSLGAPRASLSHRHIAALDALITDWHGHGAVALPGAIQVSRSANGILRQLPPSA